MPYAYCLRRKTTNLIFVHSQSYDDTKANTMQTSVQRWAAPNRIHSLSSILSSLRHSSTLSNAREQDLFGTLSDSGSKRLLIKSAERQIPDDPDGYDKLEIDLTPRKNTYYYKYEITKYARQGAPGLRRALELFQEMKSKARLAPTIDNFSPLIYGCAKAGYTKRAFELYQESIKYITKPSNSIVTCLINACAESPFPEYGLERLRWFLPHIKADYNKTLNEKQYNATIKAFGKLGQLEEASELVQEMLVNDVMPTIDTFNMLLIGCASDKRAGCTFALRVYKRIKMYELKPNLVTYRLLLRCIRDCDMGSPELIAATLEELPAVTSLEKRLDYQKKAHKLNQKNKTAQFAWAPLFSDIGKSFADAVKDTNSRDLQVMPVRDESTKRAQHPITNDQKPLNAITIKLNDSSSDLVLDSQTSREHVLPNLLSDDHLNLLRRIKSIQFDRLRDRIDRLLLFGGLQGFMVTMMENGVKPDSKTFSMILECLPATREHHLEYHKLAEQLKIQRDLVYYDLLIRHVCRNLKDKSRLETALYFIEQMHLDNLRPNISTFEALSRACSTWEKAERLMSDLEKCGFIVSEAMIVNFFKCAMARRNYGYLKQLIKFSRMKELQPSRQLVDELESLRISTNEQIRKQERADRDPTPVKGQRLCDEQVRDFDEFRSVLGTWLSKVDLREEDHPWAQFDVYHGSMKRGFKDYVKQMEAAERIKQEALKTGGNLGNLFYKAKKSVVAQN